MKRGRVKITYSVTIFQLKLYFSITRCTSTFTQMNFEKTQSQKVAFIHRYIVTSKTARIRSIWKTFVFQDELCRFRCHENHRVKIEEYL